MKAKRETPAPDHIASLTHDPKNARKHTPRNVGTIVSALHEVGAARSIVIDEDGVVLAGNATLDAAAEAGITKLRVIETDGTELVAVKRTGLTPEQKTRLALYDNRAAELAEWDVDVLQELAQENLLDGMFTADELQELLPDMLPNASLADPDDVPEPPVTPITQPGDLWLLGNHRLLCGDSTKAEDVARLMAGMKAALIAADPPYFGKVDAAWDNDFDGYEAFLGFLDSVFAQWASVMIERGTAGWWCAPDFAWHIEGLLRKRFAVFNHIVWYKGDDLGTTVSVEDMRRWRPRSERLLLCEMLHSPDALLASFNAKTAHIAARSAYSAIIERMAAWRKQAGISLVEIDKCLGTKGMAGHYFTPSQWALPTPEAWSRLRPLFLARGVDIGEHSAQRRELDAQRREFDAQQAKTDVWHMSAPRGQDRNGHPTPKPLELMAKIVGAHSRREDLVADPFLGSGTTLIAAEQLGRKCYGMEISPQYCDVIVKRWEQVTGKTAVRETQERTDA